MSHQEKLQQLVRLRSLLQELDYIEQKISNNSNNTDEPHEPSVSSAQPVKKLKSVGSISSFQKKQKFADACKQSLQSLNKTVQISDHKQLCNVIDLCITSKNQQKFWTSVQTIIPEKSATQLKEYYQKSFSKVKYDAKISGEDKNTLKQLSILMKDSKPAEVVSHFLKQYNNCNKYLKRTLVMFVVYIRK
ncbi:Hypothetical_protein [Hexamita inflata]|uniref:Hypothetical_protein n=1 Tax=Hexamita inflata TaxID=28002 RepID=A0AA86PVT0_9EUKA|nr:Hypothetical protein HINF_LOCUS29647 [Hexamita inflata]